jgi:hypothetical protein
LKSDYILCANENCKKELMFANDYNQYWTVFCSTECLILGADKIRLTGFRKEDNNKK